MPDNLTKVVNYQLWRRFAATETFVQPHAPIPPSRRSPIFVGHPLSTNFNWLLTREVLRLSYWYLPGIVYSKPRSQHSTARKIVLDKGPEQQKEGSDMMFSIPLNLQRTLSRSMHDMANIGGRLTQYRTETSSHSPP